MLKAPSAELICNHENICQKAIEVVTNNWDDTLFSSNRIEYIINHIDSLRFEHFVCREWHFFTGFGSFNLFLLYFFNFVYTFQEIISTNKTNAYLKNIW